MVVLFEGWRKLDVAGEFMGRHLQNVGDDLILGWVGQFIPDLTVDRIFVPYGIIAERPVAVAEDETIAPVIRQVDGERSSLRAVESGEPKSAGDLNAEPGAGDVFHVKMTLGFYPVVCKDYFAYDERKGEKLQRPKSE